MKNDDYKRLARAEAMANSQRAELMETLKRGYEKACEEKDEEGAAEFARKIRNKLLEESDSRMIFDRMNLDVPKGTTFTDWLGFFEALRKVLLGAWATYRKELRDLPEQEGFPFNVIFPEKPSEEE